MAAIKRKIITPFFGPLPEWFDKFKENYNQTLGSQGYEWLFTQDLEDFNKRCKDKLGFESPIVWGSPKVWDYRCALGLLYQEELKGVDFWGTMDFDVVFGDVNKFFPDEELNKVDVWSNHNTYVAGFWCLYRNIPEVNELFFKARFWEDLLQCEKPVGWVEDYYSRTLEQSDLTYKYSFMQGDPYNPPFNLQFANRKLFQDGNEIAMLHFRRDKKWPL